jgi:hypothetical protein
MLTFFLRWGRAFGRILHQITALRGKVAAVMKFFTWVLTALGAFVLLPDWDNYKPQWAKAAKLWLFSDNRWLVALLGLLLFGALLALYETEAEEERKSTVRLIRHSIVADLRDKIQYSVPDESTGYDVLLLTVEIRFMNDSEHRRYIRFPTVELQRREKGSWWRLGRAWSPLPLMMRQPYYKQDRTQMRLRGLPSVYSIWHADTPFELEPFKELIGQFQIMGTSPGGAADFIGRELRLIVGIEIIGQKRPNRLALPLIVAGYRTA